MSELRKQDLADDLATVRYYGVGQNLGTLTTSRIPHLLAAAKRVAKNPDQHFSQVIVEPVRAAARNLQPPNRYLAACALLELPPDGPVEILKKRPPVGPRRKAAASMLGLELGAFERRHERPLLEDLAEQILLLSPSSPERTPEKRTDNQQDPALYMVHFMGSMAASLYYASLNALFLPEFDETHDDADSFYVHRARGWTSIEESLFDSYCVFAGHFRSILNYAAIGELETLTALLPSESTRDLADLADSLISCGPDIDDECMSFIRFPDSFGRPGWANDGDEPVRAWFFAGWRPWFRVNLAIPKPNVWPPDIPLHIDHDKRGGVHLLAAKSHGLTKRLIDLVDFRFPLFDRAREKYIKDLVQQFRVAEWQPVASGNTLREMLIRTHAGRV